MASMLITGNTGLLTQELLDILAEEYKIIITVGEDQKEYAGKEGNLHIYCTNPMEEKFRQLFDAYNFQAVWYISGYADGGEGSFGEMQYLEQILNWCETSGVEKFIMLSGMESRNFYEQTGGYGGLVGREYESRTAFAAGQIEELCTYFARRARIKVITLWCPYLAGKGNEYQFLGQIFRELSETKKVILPYAKDDRIDLLSLRDIGSLLLQIMQETEDSTAAYYVVSGYIHTWAAFARALEEAVPQAKITFEDRRSRAVLPEYPKELRKEYGFIPRDDVVSDLGEYYTCYLEELQNRELSKWQKAWRQWKRVLKGSLKYIELFIVFFLVEYLTGYTADSVQFKFVDIRLLFIVMMAMLYGMRLGVLAAVLECIVLVRRYVEIGVSIVVLFYHIENWIPFVFYLMAGSIIGYLSDKRANELRFSEKEMFLLRDKYNFLRRVYQGVLDNRGEYRRQILGFQDSFGKIFDAVQKLDGEMAGSIFMKGLQVMEDILHNHSIAIYTLDSWQKYGRLTVCSNSLLARLTKSLRVGDVQELYDTVVKGEVYHNTEFKEGIPVYGYGVMREGRVAFLVLIWGVDTDQYGMYYMNLFRILCGLMQTSFLRAMDYEELRHAEDYYEGTAIARPEYFRKSLEIQENMKEAGISDYVLIRFYSGDKGKLNEKLTGMIRATDLLGTDEEGNIYLILTQMRLENFGVVGKRLEESEIDYKVVERVG